MSDWVRVRRQRALLTQEELAQRSGISVRTIRDLERGKIKRPYPSTLRRLDAALTKAAGANPANRTAPPDEPLLAVHQLPPDLPDFTGRARERKRLIGGLGAPRATDRPAPVFAVAGLAGVGKTALAVHVAHRLGEAFPDGQLFVDLGGAQDCPLPPATALARFLRALGVAGSAVPDSLDERSALFRSVLTGRRVLLVLDNAANEAQVRPLLAGDPGCGALVTSRRRLAGLAGARTVTLDVLDHDEAVSLFASAAELPEAGSRHAVERVVELCGRLPLAIRIAGARLAARPEWTPATLAGLLADERHRLDVLTAGDLQVRSSFALSYNALPEQHRRAFRRLGLLTAQRFPPWAAKAVLDDQAGRAHVSTAAVARLVEDLVDARLLEPTAPDSSGNARYGMHDLIRVYARERATDEDADDARRGALTRALSGWLDLAVRAERRLGWPAPDGGSAVGWRLDPADADAQLANAAEWFEIEREALAGCVDQAAAIGDGELAWQLASSLFSYSALTSSWEDCRRAHEVGLAAARECGVVRGTGYMLRGLGQLCGLAGEIDCAGSYYRQALDALRRAGDARGEALALTGIGSVHRHQGRLADALSSTAIALEIFRRLGDRQGTSFAECDLAHTLRAQGRFGEALEYYERARRYFAEVGNKQGVLAVLVQLGRIHLSLGKLTDAARHLENAQALAREVHSREGIAYALQVLGEVYIQQGRATEARSRLEGALATAREIEDHFAEGLALHSLGTLCLAGKDLAGAAASLQQAMVKWDQLNLPLQRARTLASLGEVFAARSRSGNDRAHASP